MIHCLVFTNGIEKQNLQVKVGIKEKATATWKITLELLIPSKRNYCFLEKTLSQKPSLADFPRFVRKVQIFRNTNKYLLLKIILREPE